MTKAIYNVKVYYEGGTLAGWSAEYESVWDAMAQALDKSADKEVLGVSAIRRTHAPVWRCFTCKHDNPGFVVQCEQGCGTRNPDLGLRVG